MREVLSAFKWSIGATVVGLVAAWLYGGLAALGIVAVLIALEGSISFDNAVVNATVLRRMTRRWQRAFLTVGIVIAVFGMRVVFPIAIVAVATRLGFLDVLDLALNDESAYAERVEGAAPTIGAFGGTFLLMVSLNFLLDPGRDVHWIGAVERPIARAAQVQRLPVIVVAVVLIAVSQLVADEAEGDVLLSGLIGLVAFLAIRGVARLLEERQLGQDGEGGGGGDTAGATGAAGFAAFLYLETLDASFSLDGVLGAFAITKDIVLIGLGLGVGAIYIRSLTVFLVRRETLGRYLYLTNGAHWAIGALAVILYVSIEVHVPEWLTGTVGLGTILAAFVSSVIHNRRHREDDEDRTPEGEERAGAERETADEPAG